MHGCHTHWLWECLNEFVECNILHGFVLCRSFDSCYAEGDECK